jgi:hypothetical protein
MNIKITKEDVIMSSYAEQRIQRYKTNWFNSTPIRTRHQVWEIYKLGSTYVTYFSRSGWVECDKPRGNRIGSSHASGKHFNKFEELQAYKQSKFDSYSEMYNKNVKVVSMTFPLETASEDCGECYGCKTMRSTCTAEETA